MDQSMVEFMISKLRLITMCLWLEAMSVNGICSFGMIIIVKDEYGWSDVVMDQWFFWKCRGWGKWFGVNLFLVLMIEFIS